jgi:hypothetical protein
MVEIEMLGDAMARLRAPSGRLLYVEARGSGPNQCWFVHVDGYGREAARSYPCPTRELALYRVLSELYETRSEAARSAASASSSH